MPLEQQSPATVWARLAADRQRGRELQVIAVERKINLLSTEKRQWYDDVWSESVIDWPAVADLLEAAIARDYFSQQGTTEFLVAGIELTEGDRRLVDLIAKSLGIRHPAMHDLMELLLRAKR